MEAPWLLESGLCAAIKEDPEFLSKCHSLAADVEGRTIALVTLVERLGGVLTDLDSEIREKGTRILASVLEKISRDFLNEAELQFISSFFSDRLVDQQLVIPAVLQGILAISDMVNLGRDQMCRLLQAMFRHAHCQTQIHSDRKKYYLIIRCFLYRATEEVQAMGPDFVFGFLSAMDGERDPRNLLLLFELLPELLALCPPAHLTEDMFEVVACYFPIDFQSASADPDTVSRDDLAIALVTALTATPGFATFCLPLLFEKLDSSLRLAKTDSLFAMRSAFETFPASVLETHVPDAWRALKLEALPGADAELRALALAALRALVAKLSVDSARQLDSLLDDIVAAGRDALRQVDLSLFPPAVCLLTATASASAAACVCVTARVLPMLLSQCGTEQRPQPKTQILRAITGLLSVNTVFQTEPADVAAALELCLTCGRLEGAAFAELRAESFRALSSLLPFLSAGQLDAVYVTLGDRAHDEDVANARQELCACAASAAALHPSEVLSALVRSRLSVRGAPSELTLRRRVQVRCAVAALPELTADVAADVVDLVAEAEDATQCRVGLQALGELALSESPRVQTALFADCGCVRKLTAWWVRGVRSESTPDVFSDLPLLQDTAQLLYRVLRCQPHGVQSAVLSELLPQFTEHGTESFQPLSVSSPVLQTRCLLLLEAVVGSLRKEVSLTSLLALGSQLVALTIGSADDVTQSAAARLLALIVNKAPPSETLETLICNCFEWRSRPLVCGWLTKSLLLRGHARAGESFAALTTLLDHADDGANAAAAFAILLADGGDFLDVASHCNVRPLYKQRVFTTALTLAPRARAAADAVKPNYHAVLAHVLRNTPQNILIVDIAQTVSLLVECLPADEVGLVHATLDTLSTLAESAQPLLADHLSTLVPRCLKLAQSHLAMKVRIASLECLYHFTKFPTIVLLPYKPEVIRGLAASVDDRKRLVRRAAVQARTRWFLVGAPGEPSAE